jgi:hypothetical protein
MLVSEELVLILQLVLQHVLHAVVVSATIQVEKYKLLELQLVLV